MDLSLFANVDFVKFINVSGIVPALIIIFVSFTIIRFSRNSLDLIGDKYPSYRLVVKQVSVITQFIVLFVGFLFASTKLLSISQDSMHYLIGFLAFGLSWASKDLLASLMAGVTLLLDRPFQVGDRITFSGHYGEVKDIGLRSVRVLDLDDNLITIPNSQFLQTPVACANSGYLDQMVVFHFFISCTADFVLAEQIVQESIAASRYVYWGKQVVVLMKEAPVPNGAERFAIILTAKAYVIDGRFESLFVSDVHKRVKLNFRKHQILTAGELEWSKLHI